MEEILSVQNLCKKYDELVVLDGIDLSIKKGEVVVIVGPSGCGKSTFLRCLNGLEDIQDGKVIHDGEVINPCSGKLNKVREKIGMVFQSYELFPHKTVLQNMLLAPLKVKKADKKQAEKEALELLDRVCLLSKKFTDFFTCIIRWAPAIRPIRAILSTICKIKYKRKAHITGESVCLYFFQSLMH